MSAPIVPPVKIPGNLIPYRPVTDIAPFTYRAGMTYQALLEQLRVYVTGTLTDYLTTEFGEFTDSWESNVSAVIEAVNTALTTQADDIGTKLANTLAQIVAGANIPLNDATILAVLESAGATSTAFLDGRYVQSSALAPVQQALTGVATPEMFKASAVVNANGDVTDWGPAVQAAIAAGYREIEFSATYYTIRSLIKVPSNFGLKLVGRGGLKGPVLNCFIPSGNDDGAVIDVLGETNGTGYNYAGFSMEHLQIRGNESVCHGVRMQDLSYPWLENVIIEGFRGAGLFLDLVMDGYLNVTIQGCGRTIGDYTSLADRSNNAKTTYSALHFMATRPGDHCNMLRITGDIEQNKVSPYVWIHDFGAIGLQFTDIHAEVRDPADAASGGNGFDFLVADGADCEFTGMNLSATFRAGFLLGPYGGYHFSGGRYLSNIRSNGQGDGQLVIENANVGNVIVGSWGGKHRIVHSTLNSLSIDYPANGPFMVKDAVLDDVVITNAGAGNHAVVLEGCFAKTLTAGTNVQAFVRDNEFSGSVNFTGIGEFSNNGIGGSLTLDQSAIDFVPRHHRGAQAAPPQYGTWGLTDIVWNTGPATGQPVGWVCTAAGSPGTWKPFGTIG